MAKTESTAVNELIELAKNKSAALVVEPGTDLFGGDAAHSVRRGSRPASPTLRAATAIPARAPSQNASVPSASLAPKRPSTPAARSASSAGMTVPSSFSTSSAGLTVPRSSSTPLPPPTRSSSLPSPSSLASPSSSLPSPSSSLPSPSSSLPSPSSSLPSPARASASLPAPLPRSRAPQSTAEQSIPSLPVTESRIRLGTAQPSRGTTIPPLSRTPHGTLPPPTAPVAAPFEVRPSELAARSLSSPDLPLPRQDLLFDVDAADSYAGARPEGRTREDNIALAKKLIIPAIACIAAGIGLGFYVSAKKNTSTAKPTATTQAPAPTTAPAPSAPPTETVLHPSPRSLESANAATASAGGEQPQPPTKAEQAAQMAAAAAEAQANGMTTEAPAAALANLENKSGAPALKDVRIDTDPQGASITLVDRGKQFPLGSTPLSTSLDPSRQYDVIIELAGRPSQTIHIDPAATSRLEISLGKKQAAVVPAPAPARAKADSTATATKAETKTEPTAKAETKTEPTAKAETKTEPTAKTETKKAHADAKAETKSDDVASKIDDTADTKAAPAKKSDAADAGNGTLMVSSKPPCEILIDGAPTGLTTPQKAIELPAGKHKITFVNADAGINKTVSVTIKADQPTKLIQDLMAK